MTIKVTITVPDTKIGTLLARLDGYKALCEHVPVEVPKAKLNGGSTRPRGESLLTMTGKIAQPSSKIAKAMELFELLEADRGVGTINVDAFRTELVRRKMPKALQQRCVTEKFLSYI